MLTFFRLTASLSNIINFRLSRLNLPDVDFTAAKSAKVTGSIEARIEQYWSLFKEGSGADLESNLGDLLSQRMKPRTRIRCLHLLALLLIDKQQFKDAEKNLWQALNQPKSGLDPVDELDLRLGLAQVFHLTDARELELRQLERVVVISDQHADRFLLGFKTEVLAPALLNLGEAYVAEKQLAEAAACFNRVISICSEGGSELLVANARTRLESINR